MSFYQTNKNRGFTLLETIFAIAMILIAVIAIFGLVNFGVSSIDVSKNKLIASELAQEGIELVRHWRDRIDNWGPWYTPSASRQGYFRFDIDPCDVNGNPRRTKCQVGAGPCTGWTEDTWDAAIDAISDANNLAFFQLRYDDVGCGACPKTLAYNYSCGNPINFFRIIHVSAPQNAGYGTKDMKIVTVQVFWQEGSRLRSLKVVDHLYNWLNP